MLEVGKVQLQARAVADCDPCESLRMEEARWVSKVSRNIHLRSSQEREDDAVGWHPMFRLLH